MILDWRTSEGGGLPLARVWDNSRREITEDVFRINTETGMCSYHVHPLTIREDGSLLSHDIFRPTPFHVEWDLEGWHGYWEHYRECEQRKQEAQ